MTTYKPTVDETFDFLISNYACSEGIQNIKDAGLYGLLIDELVPKLRELGMNEEAAWLKVVKKTEAYVRFNGKEITMGESYQIFNPISGQHVVCADIESAKALVLEVQKEILKAHAVTACRELRNENGDTAWLSVDFPYEVNVDFK